MIYLRHVTVSTNDAESYPLNLPSLRGMGGVDFKDVTILVGENGAGKSTFLEALARLLKLPAAGQSDAPNDETLSSVQPLTDCMRTVFARRPRTGMFMRAEDFFGYTRRISALQDDMRAELKRVDEEYASASAFTRGQARMAYSSALYELEAAHGQNPDAQSHGESFLHLFQTRIHSGGLYLLDEPEAPLSALRQLALLKMIMDGASDSQFIIATHSPIIAACPDATILSFDEAPAREVQYESLDNINLLRDFLNSPHRFIEGLKD